jgi:transposase-like protein
MLAVRKGREHGGVTTMALEDFLWRGFGPGDDESVLPQDLGDQVTALDLNQKQELLKSLKLLIAREFLRDPVDGGMPSCPHCDSTRVVRKGKNKKNGGQRWLCKRCGRTFSASTSSVLALSKLPEETWLTYAEGMAEGKTPGQLAEMCEVSLKTSWYMRMRLCEAMGAHLPVASFLLVYDLGGYFSRTIVAGL